jgi:hypothetical protein
MTIIIGFALGFAVRHYQTQIANFFRDTTNKR